MLSGFLNGPILIAPSVSITCIYDILVLISNDIKSRKSFEEIRSPVRINLPKV